MILSDIVLLVALFVALIAWWKRRAPSRTVVVAGAATIALLASIYGAVVDRWQAVPGGVAALLLLVSLVIWNVRRSPRRDRVPFISGTLLALLVLIAFVPIYLYPVTDLPKPSGKYSVGVRSFELADRNRLGVFSAADDQPRRLLVRVWYPAQSTEGLKPRPYFSALEAEHTARSMGALFGFPPYLAYMRNARTNSYEGAPLLTDAAHLPTVIYSHGYTSFLSQNTALMEELASHGYVVYSVQHTDDASATVFPNGDVVPMAAALANRAEDAAEEQGKFPEAMVKGYTSKEFDERIEGQLQQAKDTMDKKERIVESAAVWLADRLFVHDQLQQGAVPADVAQIVAASKLDRVGEIGMSFGGSTSGGVCMVDARCAAGVNLDGGDFHLLPFNADVPRPFLMFHSDIRGMYRAMNISAQGSERSFNDFSYERFEHAGQRPDMYRLHLKDSQHLGLSDFPLFVRRPMRDAMLGTTPAEVMIGAQNDFVRGFFDKYVRGVANDFPKSEYQKYRGWALPYNNAAVRDWWLSKSEAERQTVETHIQALKQRVSQAATAAPATAE